MQDDGREETARRARRVLLAFRLTFYPAAVAVAALLLLGRGQAADEPVTVLEGRTSQGERFLINVDREGHATFFDTRLVTYCGRLEEPWPVRWWPGDGSPVPFDQDGRRLEVSEDGVMRYDDATGRREYHLAGEVDERHASGVMSAVERVDPADGEDYSCLSGDVRFTARR